jgi:hypothetical protein
MMDGYSDELRSALAAPEPEQKTALYDVACVPGFMAGNNKETHMNPSAKSLTLEYSLSGPEHAQVICFVQGASANLEQPIRFNEILTAFLKHYRVTRDDRPAEPQRYAKYVSLVASQPVIDSGPG